MAYPPTVPPNSRLDTTPLATNHISDHNAISNALTDIINELGSAPKGAAASLTALLAEIDPADKIIAIGGSTAPTGWYLCNGDAVSRTTYAATFARIGTTYGAGNGSTTFNLPDLRSKFVAGKGTAAWSNALTDTGGSKDAVAVSHTHGHPNHGHGDTLAAPAHSHAVNPPATNSAGTYLENASGPHWTVTSSAANRLAAFTTSAVSTNIASFTSGGASATALTGGVSDGNAGTTNSQNPSASGTDANLPPYQTLNYCIRLR